MLFFKGLKAIRRRLTLTPQQADNIRFPCC